MDQMEGGTGGRRKDSPTAVLEHWTLSCFSVEFIPFHKGEITHHVELAEFPQLQENSMDTWL